MSSRRNSGPGLGHSMKEREEAHRRREDLNNDYICSSGPFRCLLRKYAHNPGIRVGHHATREDAERCYQIAQNRGR